MRKLSVLYIIVLILSSCSEEKKLKALIIDGQNNHYIWPKTTQMLKDYLEQTTMFSVTISRTDSVWLGENHNKSRSAALDYYFNTYTIDSNRNYPLTNPPLKTTSYSPNFEAYDLIISNMGWKAADWNDATKVNFENYIKKGGGLVIIHAANNSWGDWDEFNKMIGLGGWGDRTTASGPYVYYNNSGNLVRDPSHGISGSHGPEHEYTIDIRVPNHPITKGMPASWLHAKDELYDRLRGPAINMTVLATAYSDLNKNNPTWASQKGSERSEPMLMTINYGKGRIFHTAMGHFDYSMECVGFITSFLRGAEWVATGKVTQTIPDDFPTKNKTSSRKWAKSKE